MEKFILINKKAGWTSFDVVAYIRKQIKQKNPDLKKIKVGHAGTLDPFAEGLLIVGVGREATKKLDEYKKLPKTYITSLRLGQISDTGDPTGKIIATAGENTEIPINKISAVLNTFIGEQEQVPPMYSAKKIEGQRLYDLARKGITVKREPAKINIYSVKLLVYDFPHLKIEVKCSTGTYIRTLAEDIGRAIGSGAYCEELKRTAIGTYSLEQAKNVEDVHLIDAELSL